MLHIIGFYSHDKPRMVIRDAHNLAPSSTFSLPPIHASSLVLEGDIDFDLSTSRYCIGFSSPFGVFPCPEQKISRGTQCASCRSKELTCARCTGECVVEQNFSECMRTPHIVYLASFGGIVKVGVSGKERYPKRWLEQGADCAVVVAESKSGMEARQTESLLAWHFGFKTALTTSMKISLLRETPQKSKLALEAAVARLAKFPSLEPSEIVDLSPNYPKLNCMPSLTNQLAGRVIGAKGNILFLEKDGLLALNMKGCIGKYVMGKNGHPANGVSTP
ncbi:MAG: DUF2797 domain-containing protein [Candidatus Micrarchaeota archaeon]|nr:DUF2797 domain-containing protein [Candidatus Micrarchaeota archaeon]